MLARLKQLFSGPREYPVEIFGKLPCYQDYISLVTSPASVHWRDWLLERFRDTSLPPEGLWPFIYQHRKNGEVVIGMVRASSDGLREFPFSLFVAGGRAILRSPSESATIWRELAVLHGQLLAAPDIQGVYARCAGRKIVPVPERDGGVPSLVDLLLRTDRGPRLLIVAPGSPGTLHLVWEGGMPEEVFERTWQGLRPQQPA
jgi:hypothetical protein